MIRSGAESERVGTRIAYILDDEPEFRDFITQIATGLAFRHALLAM